MPATSQDQQRAAAIALHAPASELHGSSKEMAKSMSKEELHKFASTKRSDLPKKVHNEGQQRIIQWLNQGRPQQIEERGAHAKGCKCGFCKNKGNIANYWQGKLKDAAKGKHEEEEPKDMTEGLEQQIAEVKNLGQVKLSKASGPIGAANKTYHNMTSKQAMTPEWKPKAFQKADAEATNQLGRMKGFKIKGEGETTSGKPLPKTRPGESIQRAQVVAAKLLDD